MTRGSKANDRSFHSTKWSKSYLQFHIVHYVPLVGESRLTSGVATSSLSSESGLQPSLYFFALFSSSSPCNRRRPTRRKPVDCMLKEVGKK